MTSCSRSGSAFGWGRLRSMAPSLPPSVAICSGRETGAMRVVPLGPDDLPRIGEIDRSEVVEGQLAVVDGRLVEHPVVMAEIPPWDPVGSGPHSVAAHIDWCGS